MTTVTEATPAPARPSRPRVAAGVALVLLALVPLLVPANVADMLTRVLAFALLAVGLDLLTGVAGLASLGQAAPFGAGAYTAALLGKHATTVGPVQLVAAAVAGGLLAAAVGWLLVRARGTYFLMLTLAVAEIVHELAGRWEGVTGGTNGLAGVPPVSLYPGGPPVRLAGVLYWYALAAVLVCAGALWVVSRSAFGRTLRGVRDNEERMRSLGYRTFVPKYAVFCIAGAAAGAAGSLWVAQARFVSPADLGFEVSAMALLAVVIGGRGSLWGAALGAAVVVLVRDELSPQLGGRGPLVLGLVFVAAVYLLPRGFAGTRLPRSRTEPGP
ncbi:MAG TPA: branched-chain amino acid ABC transporter permease [Actinomycetota bacterium]